jgi:trk system potassium uptake protein TrkH
MGGVGIVIFAIAMLPFLGIGGMQIFQRENSDVNEKFMPKISYIAKRIIGVYLILMVVCVTSLIVAGMGWFDALCHTLTTISTGGFSTKNASIGFFNSPTIEWLITLFMFLGAIPLTFYHSLLATKDIHSLRSSQVVVFIKVLAVYVLIVSTWLIYNGVYSPFDALRHAAFNIVSIVTSTGYNSANWLNWGAFAATAFVIFALTGGCTGSTSGGVKIFRWQIVLAQLKRSFITTTEPNRLLPLKVDGITISHNVASSIFVFFIAYAFSVAVISLLVALSGVDFATAFSATIACITNSGPGNTQIIGPAGSYASLSEYVKVLLAFTMILGRLEVLTVLVLFTKSFWR